MHGFCYLCLSNFTSSNSLCASAFICFLCLSLHGFAAFIFLKSAYPKTWACSYWGNCQCFTMLYIPGTIITGLLMVLGCSIFPVNLLAISPHHIPKAEKIWLPWIAAVCYHSWKNYVLLSHFQWKNRNMFSFCRKFPAPMAYVIIQESPLSAHYDEINKMLSFYLVSPPIICWKFSGF